MNHADLLRRIETAPLSAEAYRTARRFLDRTAPHAALLQLSYADAQAIVGSASPNTLKGHLGQLRRAGLLHYSQNGSVNVIWQIAPRSSGSPGDLQDRPTITGDGEPDRGTIFEIAGRSDPLTPDRDTIPEIAPRSLGSPGDLKDRATIPPVGKDLPPGREVGKDDPTLPPYLEGSGEPTAPPTTEQARSLALLTDPDVGCSPAFAADLAASYSFEQILRQVMRAARELNQPKPPIVSFGIIRSRLERRAAASILPADRETALWQRHCGLDADLLELARWVPAGYEDSIDAGATADQLERLRAWRRANGELPP